MSFYGLVLILTVLAVSVYLPAFVSEINAINWMSGVYTGIGQAIRTAGNALVQNK